MNCIYVASTRLRLQWATRFGRLFDLAPPEHRADFDLRLQDAKAALDVGKGLVARHDVDGFEVLHVGDEQQLAIHQFGQRQRIGIDVPGKQITLQVHLDDVREAGFLDGVIEARLGAAVEELTAAGGGAVVLRVELAAPCGSLRFQRKR